jgi:hypothetical protein
LVVTVPCGLLSVISLGCIPPASQKLLFSFVPSSPTQTSAHDYLNTSLVTSPASPTQIMQFSQTKDKHFAAAIHHRPSKVLSTDSPPSLSPFGKNLFMFPHVSNSSSSLSSHVSLCLRPSPVSLVDCGTAGFNAL